MSASADRVAMLRDSWVKQRWAMHCALQYERFLSPVQRKVLPMIAMGSAHHLKVAARIEDELRQLGAWDRPWPGEVAGDHPPAVV